MSVRFKIFLCLLGVAALVWAVSSYLAKEIFLDKFKTTDSQNVAENVSRVRDTILQQKDILVVAAKLWSTDSQDDLQKFLQLVNLNLVAFVDANGRISRANWRNTTYSGTNSLAPADAESLAKQISQARTKGDAVSGILSTSYGPMLFAAYTFTESDLDKKQAESAGPKAVGIVTGRLLDASFENSLKSQLLTDVELLPPSQKFLDLFRQTSSEITTQIAENSKGDRIAGYCILDDISGQPALAIRVTEVRQMYNMASSSLEFFLTLTGVCGMVVVVVGTLFVEVLVTKRIRKLTSSAKHADQSGMDDLPNNFTTGSDEISTLARITKSTVERLHNARLLYRAVVETQADLIVRFEPDGNIVFANLAFARFVNRHQKALAGTNIGTYFTQENTNTNFLESCKTHCALPRSEVLEIQYTDANDRKVWLEWAVKSIRDQGNDPEEFQIVGHDVTLRREHAANLEFARKAAEDANLAKAEFLAIMEHESRTPLSCILGISLVLETTGLSKEQKEYVSLIQASGNSLLTLLNDLNDYSTLGQDFTLTKTTIHIPTLIRETMLIHSPNAMAKELDLDSEFDIDAPEFIEGDSSRVRQVLNNLIDNGIKFTTHGFVRLGVGLSEPGKVRFYVKDSGIGISEEGIKRLFQPFSTAQPENMRRRGGPGIGLVVSQKLVQQMGGQIAISSQVNLGSLFYFDLPVGHPKASDSEDEGPLLEKNGGENYSLAMLKADNVSRQSLRILVIDDNAINCKVACHLLRRIGFEADSANGGRLGVEKAARHPYDMVFMDIQMPDIDGFEAAKLLREMEEKNPDRRPSYIVACTAFSQPGDRKKCIQAGMDNYIKKPLEPLAMREIFDAYFAVESTPA